jgi:hypothetical protein
MVEGTAGNCDDRKSPRQRSVPKEAFLTYGTDAGFDVETDAGLP